MGWGILLIVIVIGAVIAVAIVERPKHKQATGHAKPMMRPNRNDPCPCGSGKKFGKCHGKRH